MEDTSLNMVHDFNDPSDGSLDGRKEVASFLEDVQGHLQCFPPVSTHEALVRFLTLKLVWWAIGDSDGF